MSATKEYDKLLDALRAQPKGANGMSMRQIASALGLCASRTQLKVRSAIEAGVMEFAGKRSEPSVTGAMQSIPVYRLKGKR